MFIGAVAIGNFIGKVLGYLIDRFKKKEIKDVI